VSSQTSLWTGLLGIGATIALVQPIAAAKSSVEIGKTAQAITVQITEPNNVGSGVILQRQGEIYTVLTAAHVVQNKANYTITTPDDRKYQIISSSIRSAPGSIDLAVIKFKSTTNYPTAKLGNCNALERGMELYVGGFPGTSKAITESIFVFREGKVSANSNKVLENGYSLVYSNDTLPGMSGGAVLNSEGELVAIHGRGDRDQNNLKNGFNLGIPVNRFATVATNMGVELGQKVAPIPTNTAPKADDYFALAVQKYEKQDYQGSLADLNRAISLDPNLALAYNNRGLLKEDKLNDPQGSLADYNRAISLAPNFAGAYSNRGLLKKNKLNDPQGSLADYNRAITLAPDFAVAYLGRGWLKQEKLNDRSSGVADVQKAARLFQQQGNTVLYQKVIDALKKIEGQNSQPMVTKPSNAEDYYRLGANNAEAGNYRQAIVDFSRLILLDPNDAFTYYNRGLVKAKSQDLKGAISDMQQAAKLYQQQGRLQAYKYAIAQIARWRQTENNSGF
jgi:tetratricopeptide (TPR) repeat protein